MNTDRDIHGNVHGVLLLDSMGNARGTVPIAEVAAGYMQGVVCIIPIAPYYGVRKPKNQKKWFLRQVSDAFVQALSIAVETACLLHWAKKTWGPDIPLATAGLSFGGAMAALAAKMYNGPLAIISYMGCLGPGEPFSVGATLLLAPHLLTALTVLSEIQRTQAPCIAFPAKCLQETSVQPYPRIANCWPMLQ